MYSNHQALHATFNKKNLRGRLVGRLSYMAGYTSEICHSPGDTNVIANYFPRRRLDASFADGEKDYRQTDKLLAGYAKEVKCLVMITIHDIFSA